MKAAFYLITALVAGFVLMYPLAAIFDHMNWPLFNGWAIGHGTFVIAWPVLTLVVYCGLVTAEKKRR